MIVGQQIPHDAEKEEGIRHPFSMAAGNTLSCIASLALLLPLCLQISSPASH